MKWKNFKKQNSFMQTRLHKQNICKEMHQDHYFLLIEIMITCEFLLCFFFLLIYNYRFKTNDCVYFFIPPFKEYYAPAPWPSTSHSQSNQTQAQKMSSKAPSVWTLPS